MHAAGIDEPFAQEFIDNALHGSGTDSLLRRYKYDITFKSDRNRHEALALAAIVDQMRLGNHSTALELVVRRHAGVQAADGTNSFALCDTIAGSQQQSFLPERVLMRAIKAVALMQQLQGDSSGRAGNRDRSTKKQTTNGGAAWSHQSDKARGADTHKRHDSERSDRAGSYKK